MIRGLRSRGGWAGLVLGGPPPPSDDPLVRVQGSEEQTCRAVVEAAAHLPLLGRARAGELARWSRSRLAGRIGEHTIERAFFGPLLVGLGLDGVDEVEVRAGVLGPLGHDVPVVAVVSAAGSLVLARSLGGLLDQSAVFVLDGP